MRLLMISLLACLLPNLGWSLGPVRAIPKSPQAGPGTCTARDFSEKLGPNRNQGVDGFGWCYAYAAADMATFALGYEVSASDIAATYNEKVGRYPGIDGSPAGKPGAYNPVIEGGMIGAALNATDYSGGFCPETVIRSERMFGGGAGIGTIVRTLSYEPESVSCRERIEAMEELFPQQQVFSEIARVLNGRNITAGFFAANHLACKGQRKNLPANMQVRAQVGPFDDEDGKPGMMSRIDSQLTENKIVGIHYFINRLSRSFWKRNFSNRYNYAHASTIVGRRFNATTGQCEYRIRNTWGIDCVTNDPDDQRCERGDIWVTKSTLKAAVYSMTYFADPAQEAEP
jgi:hypothetical protein